MAENCEEGNQKKQKAFGHYCCVCRGKAVALINLGENGNPVLFREWANKAVSLLKLHIKKLPVNKLLPLAYVHA
jgi:hypothetical protein